MERGDVVESITSPSKLLTKKTTKKRNDDICEEKRLYKPSPRVPYSDGCSQSIVHS